MGNSDLELGPVDVVVFGFAPGAPRTGSAIPLFVDLVERGIIRVLDVLMVEKDKDGNTAGIEITDVDGDGFQDLIVFAGARSGLLGEEDAAAAAEALEPDSAAVLICFENTWAAPFVTEVRKNGGEVLAFDRVAAADLVEALESLPA